MTTTHRGAFVGLDVPSLVDLQNCIHCGFCLPSCPTYLATGQELESPRGRLHLIRGVLDNRIEASDRVLGHLDLCLQCRACETACPSGVPYGRIMEDARASVMARGPAQRPRSWSLRSLLLRHVIAKPRVLRAALAPARLYARSGLQRLVRGRLPGALGRLEARMPLPRGRAFRRRGALASPPEPVVRVALLTGCVHGELTPSMHEATVRVLARLGRAVVAPPAAGCCGALHAHAGDVEAARDLAKRNIEAFEAAGIEAVIVNAAGCGAAMKEYGRLLRHDPAWAERAERFAPTVRDVLEYVAGIEGFEAGLAPLGPGATEVTLQDACHLAHAQGIREAPRRLLRAIPGVELREMRTPDRCCGSAGLYSLVQPAMSQAVLEAKMDDVEGTGASVVCTSNPGCTLQIEAGVRVRGLEARVEHVIELLDASYRAGATSRFV
ncbi:MAG: heterodisulfide reductase-related iron-sulfur binding cluster [Dehalococcoidia bacterium]